ncbi:Ig-like domain-containing protein [Frondihabitans sp. PhB188]|uniref:Ig-like domain-containing protein n=1 Tax=Frondihabitans sp. PhB188 TaxID=2485200 RepID=UPI0011CD67C4|nr:Ig-like domain-containing protein [Frondihabitans sp. PhB188]
MNRTAKLTGAAKPDSTVVIDDNQEVDVDSDGNWSAVLEDLNYGKNSTHLENWGDGKKISELDFMFDLDVAAVTGTASATTTVTDDVTIAGTGEKNVDITITDEDGKTVATTKTDSETGRYEHTVAAPNASGAHTFTVTQSINGTDAGSTSVEFIYGAATTITSPVDNYVHPGGTLTFSGRGEPQAQVRIQEEGKTGILQGGHVLSSGAWSLRVAELSNAKHTLVVTQTGKGNNITTATLVLNPDGTVDPGDGEGEITAPTVESPGNNSNVTTSRPVFTGHGHPGATVKIGYGPNSTIGTATVDADGEWTANLTSGLALGRSTLIVTQTSGKDTQTLTHIVNRVAAEAPFRVTSHTNNENYAEGMTTFRGTAAVGATIRAVNQWGTVMGTDTADGTGNWAFNRNLGPTTTGYDITFTATKDGRTETTQLHLNYQGVIAFQVTSPANNSTYEVGNATFRGKASPNTVVTAVNQWNTRMGTATANLDGDWAFSRNLGPTTAGYDIRFTATKGDDVQRSTLHISQAVTNVPVEVTSIADGATYTPGLNILRGTGTPNATITAVNAKNGWNVAMGTTKVTADGTWALPERNWGPSNDYEIKVTQTNPDKTTSTTMVNIFAPVFKDLEVTGVTTGAENGPGAIFATFTGTATPGGSVTIKSASTGSPYQTVEVNPQGQWTATRTWNATHTYNLIFDQVAKDGKTDSVNYGTWTATTPPK